MDKLKVGVLGLRRGRTYVNNFLALDNCVLVGAADQFEMHREAMREQIEAAGGKVVNEFEQLLDLKPDAVMVASNARVHAAHSIQAMEAGCHVLSEIPTGFYEHELVELRDAVERTGKLYMAAENSCFLDFLRYWRKWLVDGKLGEVSLAHCEYVHYLPQTLKLPDGGCLSPSEAEAEGRTDLKPVWRADQPPIQYLTHDLGPLLEVFDDRAVLVTCMSAPTYAKEAPLRSDGQIAVFKTAQGRIIQCTVTLNTHVPAGHRYRIFGTKGGAEHSSYEKVCRAAFGHTEPHPDWVWTKLGSVAQGEDTSTGHGGVDIKVARAFANAILEGKSSPIDIYRGIDYTLPGIVAARSADQGGVPLEIPDLRPEPFAGTRFWDHVPLPEHAELDDVRRDPPPRES